MTDPAILSDLQRAYRDGGLLPFVGAGLPMSVSWTVNGDRRRGPSWAELVDAAARQLGFTDAAMLRARGEDLQILEYFRERHGRRIAPLTNWLVLELTAPDDVLARNPILQALAQLSRCSTMYTTNFDDFLERGLVLNGRETAVVATEEEIKDLLVRRVSSPNVCEIVKFHGDLNHPDQMVVTESDYRQRLALEATMDDRLKADLLGRVVLFLGYSFRDWNVSYLFHVLERLHGSLPGSVAGRRGYITVAEPSDFEVRLFEARHIGVIPIRSTNMTDDVASLVRSIAGGAP
ncbi:MAG TPA: SIR2 family protein [Acidimicrobiales bacterium]|nr:SIR2 family protein [Acidimicrobiales bacterium]